MPQYRLSHAADPIADASFSTARHQD